MKATGVTSGYLTDYGFTTRYNEYESYYSSDLDDDVIATNEEKEAWEAGDELYRTADGKLFLNYKTATEYAKTVEIPELNEVIELLEKAKILCEKYKDKSPLFSTMLNVFDEMKNDGGESMLDKYYDSSC